MEATESSMGFHRDESLGSVLGGRAISFQSGAINSTSEMMIPMGGYFGGGGVSSCMSMIPNGNLGGGIVQVQACNSPASSLLHDPAPSFKNDSGLAAEWSVDEQYRLEEGLEKFSSEPSIMKYVKIAAMIPEKTVRDVALRCRWMTRKRRKAEDYNAGKKVNHRKDKLVESSSKLNVMSTMGQNLSVYPLMMQTMNRTASLPFEGLSGTSRHLLEQNVQALNQISTNLSSFKFQENMDLFCRTRNNISAVLNDMSGMPGIMSLMPPLPVSINEDLADSLFPSQVTHPFSSINNVWVAGREPVEARAKVLANGRVCQGKYVVFHHFFAGLLSGADEVDFQMLLAILSFATACVGAANELESEQNLPVKGEIQSRSHGFPGAVTVNKHNSLTTCCSSVQN
ncbi:hypothetical protein LINPERPRIM_LOCUS23562 [Linum perenne]